MRRPHKKTVILLFIAYLLGMGAISPLLGYYLWALFPFLRHGFTFIVFIAIMVLFSILLSWWFAKKSYEGFKYEINEDYIQIEEGVFWKDNLYIPFWAIESLAVREPPLLRIVGLANLVIYLRNNSLKKRIKQVEIPGLQRETAFELKDEILKRIAAQRGET